MSIDVLDRKEAPMAGDKATDIALKEIREPILEKKTDTMGWVKIYAPDCDPVDWDKSPWILETERSKEGRGLKMKIAACHVYTVFERPYFAGPEHLF